MGGCSSSNNSGGLSPQEANWSNNIDREIERRRQQQEDKVKLLLLGAGESGKSTIFKQMRILYGTPPTQDDDLRYYGTTVRANIVVAIRKLLMVARKMGIEIEQEMDKETNAIQSNGGYTDPKALTLREAYDILIENLVEKSGEDALEGLADGWKKPPPKPKMEEDGDTPQDAPVNEEANGENGDSNNLEQEEAPKEPEPPKNETYDPYGELEASAPKSQLKDWVGTSQRAGKIACDDSLLFLKLVEPIRLVWNSESMKLIWAKRATLNVNDSHKDYLRDMARIAAHSYRPTTQDILLARVRTTTVIVETFRIDDIDFEMYDVGGQRSERRKWIECFDEVDAVIFVAALSEYDQNLEESKKTNRMVEALELFRSISNNTAFVDTSIMLFLNKKDLFAEKLLTSDIVAQKPFSDYFGPPKDFDHGVQYFIEKFKDCLMDDDFSENFIHVTMATDTNNMEFVLEASKTIIMNENLARSGFLGTD